MSIHPGKLAAIFGIALIALSLTGSTRNAAIHPKPIVIAASGSFKKRRDEAGRLYKAARYAEAREHYLLLARSAEAAHDSHTAAISWNSAGGLSIFLQQYRDALNGFVRARKIAEDTGDSDALARTLNNLASLYLTMGNWSSALNISREALAIPLPKTGTGPWLRAILHSEEAMALAHLGRFNEAQPLYLQSAGELEDFGDLTNAARILGLFGIASMDAKRLEVSETALSRALALVRIHRLDNGANILRGLARLRASQGDSRSAAGLFQAALDSPAGAMPQWLIYADRGDFRSKSGDRQGALEDFRESRRLAKVMRADVVPADQDRVTLEGGLSRVAAGLVEAGNELAVQSQDRDLLDETFAAAEQDRLWSLRALIPEPNDWRTRLPAAYWDALARYQTIERVRMATPAPDSEQKAASLRQELEQMEAAAAQNGGREPRADGVANRRRPGSELSHVQKALDSASVLFSFHIGKSTGWVWVADREHAAVYRIGDVLSIKSDAAALASAIQKGDASAETIGRRLYRNLFEGAPNSFLGHSRWLLELDGPLFDVPFPALIAEEGDGKKSFLAVRAALEIVPSALMLRPREAFRAGEFLGIGDPIYNIADNRYKGTRGKALMTLPRLPATGPELTACSREWGAKTQLLTGEQVTAPELLRALGSDPAVVHFATHVVAGPGEYSSGLIALSLSRAGALAFLGPTEIVAHPVKAQLVVLNGCHSAQGEALPGTGLMGLTRAWIGAGAKAVLATRWDISDDAGKAVMVAFYRALRANPEQGPAVALQQAQLEVARGNQWPPAVWAAYFLLAQE